MAHPRAGTLALPEDLVDVDALVRAYYDNVPDPSDPLQQVVFGTSGHRGSSFDNAFNEAHILATTQAIVDYRRSAGISGPLFIGFDTHALSVPAWRTALEVLAANEITVYTAESDSFTPTPAVSRAILTFNRDNPGVSSDGIVVTPSHNPPRDGGFKYNPPTGGPADTAITSVVAARANELLAQKLDGVKRIPFERARGGEYVHDYSFLLNYIDGLGDVVDMTAIRDAASGSVPIRSAVRRSVTGRWSVCGTTSTTSPS